MSRMRLIWPYRSDGKTILNVFPNHLEKLQSIRFGPSRIHFIALNSPVFGEIANLCDKNFQLFSSASDKSLSLGGNGMTRVNGIKVISI